MAGHEHFADTPLRRFLSVAVVRSIWSTGQRYHNLVNFGVMLLGMAVFLIFVFLMILCVYHVYLVTSGATISSISCKE